MLIDLNRDGNRDLAVANLFDSTISLIFGDASGSFAWQENFAFTNDAPHAITLSDVDENGIVDLITANRDSATVGVFLGDGVGGVQDPTFVSTGQGPRWIAVADFNQDMHDDLAVTNRDDDNVTVLLGDGLGNFTSAGDFFSGDGPVPIVAADFNNDGFIDLAVGNDIANTLVVLIGDGTGQFITGPPFIVGDAPKNIAVGDLNQDGLVDLAVACVAGQLITVLYADGTGSFTTRSYATGGGPFAVVLEDFDNDGKTDMAVGDGVNDAVLILLNDGLENFVLDKVIPAGLAPHDMVTADFNGDSRPDLAVANTGDDSVTVLLNETPPQASVRVLSVIQELYSNFYPDPIISLVNQPLRLSFTTDNREHINRLRILPWISATDLIRVGEILTVEFTPEETGNYQIENIGHGFTGSIIIVEDEEALKAEVTRLGTQEVSLIHSSVQAQVIPSSVSVFKDIPLTVYNISLDEPHYVSILPWLPAPDLGGAGNVVPRAVRTFEFTPDEGGGFDILHTVHGFNGRLIIESEPLVINIRLVGNQVELTWSGGVLQEAGEVIGPWSDVEDEDLLSPYLDDIIASRKFYRAQENP
ncbi:MAG: VCBS repeat-containing protein [Candidatus Poribacteria bacterium]|nr:VCBS repeat-containing protein [Candidatus Poribacteria bacterium]